MRASDAQAQAAKDRLAAVDTPVRRRENVRPSQPPMSWEEMQQPEASSVFLWSSTSRGALFVYASASAVLLHRSIHRRLIISRDDDSRPWIFPAGRPFNPERDDEPMTGCDRTVRYGAAYGVWYAGKVTNAGPASPRWRRRFLCSSRTAPLALPSVSDGVPVPASIVVTRDPMFGVDPEARASRRPGSQALRPAPKKTGMYHIASLLGSRRGHAGGASGWMTLACHTPDGQMIVGARWLRA
ncbi:hypothetical protein VTN00DRAFT_5361 [Thermoascus crustaceus]|uniref:uncharacterized protein n=1 Tax=Thermoascus crustaceus TaxID=5088 RepID=UPI003742C2CE